MPQSSSSVALARSLFLVAAVAWPTAATAADPAPSAGALVERGLELRRARDDAAALAAFEQAYQAQPSPMLLAQIALAEQALGRFVTAEQHLTKSLSSPDAWIDQRRAALEAALRVIQSRLGWVEVSANAEEVEVWLDDELKPLASSPFRVMAGSHTLVLRARTGVTTRRVVELRGGDRYAYQLELSAAPAPAVAQALPSPPPAKSRPSTEPRRAARTWAYAAAAVTGVALAEAIAASLLRQRYVDDYNGPSCAPDRSERCAAYRSSANTFGTIALVGYAVAGVAGVTSITLFTEPWWNRPGAASSSAVVGVSGAF